MNQPKTPQKLEKIVKYYRIDKEGNRVEVEGPLTPNSNNLPHYANSVTPQKQVHSGMNLDVAVLNGQGNEKISFTPIGIRGCQTGDTVGKFSTSYTPAKNLNCEFSQTEAKANTARVPNTLQSRTSLTTEKAKNRDYPEPVCSIPPLVHNLQSTSPPRNYSIPTYTNLESGCIELDSDFKINSRKNNFKKPVVNFFECPISKIYQLQLICRVLQNRCLSMWHCYSLRWHIPGQGQNKRGLGPG